MSFLASTVSGTLARGLSTSARASAPIKEFVVIGGGLMGAGIAQVRPMSFTGFHFRLKLEILGRSGLKQVTT